jgi:uncharacterized membrane protein YhaH (DUF805 family)
MGGLVMATTTPSPRVISEPADLNGAPLGFGPALHSAARSTLQARGRASRSAYWWVQLFFLVVGVVTVGGSWQLAVDVPATRDSELVLTLSALVVFFYVLAYLMIGVPLLVRRLHDISVSGWWWLLSLVPFGIIMLLAIAAVPGSPHPNQYDVTPAGF